MSQEINTFSFLKGMTIEKEDFDFENPLVNKEYNQRTLNRYLSSIEMFIPFVNEINKCKGLSNKEHYTFFKSILPQKSIFFKYLKPVKEVDELSKKCLMRYYNISKRECDMYVEILTEKQIKDIVSIYNKEQLKAIEKDKL
jgi:hypothetical protein